MLFFKPAKENLPSLFKGEVEASRVNESQFINVKQRGYHDLQQRTRTNWKHTTCKIQ